jgi:hypothetical protein
MAHDTLRAMRAIALVLAFLALPAHAILIRADRDDAEYVEMATRYASSVFIEPIASGGALVASRWILTDGASAKRLDAIGPRPMLKIGTGGARVQSVFLAPDQRLGLVLLDAPVRGVQPNALYRGADEQGKTAVLASFGPTGTIGAPGTREEKLRRAGINTVDRVDAAMLGLRIKPLDDASDLQAAAVDGDRGSPLYVENDDGIFVIGIAAPSQPAAEFGASNLYARVSTALGWIEETMLEEAKGEMNRLLDPERR